MVPTLDDQGQVRLADLSGKITVMPLDQFLDGLNSVVYDNGHSSPPEWTRDHSKGRPGGATGLAGGASGGNDWRRR